MKVLIADDNVSVHRVLEALLKAWDYTVVSASDGIEAWNLLQQPDAPALVILDWMMPGMDGIDICRNLRSRPAPFPAYVILLTCRGHKEDIVAGLEAGADDYITKPFETEELRARIQVGRRYVELQQTLSERMHDLQRQKQELARSNRALKLLNESNQSLTRSESENELLQSLCRDIVEIGGYRLAWIGFTEDGSVLRFRPVAQSGFEEGALEAMRLAWSEADVAKSPVGKAIQSGRPAVVKDIFADRRYMHRQVDAASRGFSSLVAIPFTISPSAQGVLNVYAREPDAFDSKEVVLLAKLAENLAYGINAIRTAVDRRRMEEELQQERDQAQLYLDVAAVLIVALDRDGTITMINAKGCTILGCPQQEMLGKNWFALCSSEEQAPVLQNEYDELMRGKREFREYFERTIVTRNGTERILAIHASLLGNKDGTVAGLLFSGEDVTERKKAEEALRSSEENYRTLFDRMVSTTNAISAYRSSNGES